MAVINVSGAAFAHPDGNTLFDDVSFKVRTGRHAALVGANGVGKSTLLRCITGELSLDEGAATTDGHVALMPQSIGTGEDAAVAQFVFSQPQSQALVGKISDLLGVVIPLAEQEGKDYLTIAVGCTGGRHRSVAVVRELERRLKGGRNFTVRHRDLERRGRE